MTNTPEYKLERIFNAPREQVGKHGPTQKYSIAGMDRAQTRLSMNLT
ncbi:MAG: hypothetical protein KDF58_06005 [Alphaproteobacteria bacterium]|nr:hypothetical protein [Alphaproteobacteria bacterium]HPF45368.1 hypothetical protein [Emcibacteraceae bacterium]HRW29838.1 hypothetical protein [Emcibacteraceae bacterium]